MASGDSLLYFSPMSSSGPASSAAQLDALAGASSPAESFPILAFDSASTEYADFRGKLPQNYAGGGLTLVICSGAGTTTGGIRWEAAFRSFEDDAEDLDTTVFTYDFNGVSITTLPNVQGEVSYDNITFSDTGTDMDTLDAGDEFLLRVRRLVSHADDTAAADGYIHGMELRET